MVKLINFKEEDKMEEQTINLIGKAIGLASLFPFYRLMLEELTGGTR